MSKAMYISPCPFCGSDSVKAEEDWDNGWVVTCDVCEAVGPWKCLKKDAIIAWNRAKRIKDTE